MAKKCYLYRSTRFPDERSPRRSFATGPRRFRQVLTTCRHEHLVPLLGICVDPTPMLVYPFVGHSLEWHLREPDRRAAISWSTRLSVALAVTKGLQVGFNPIPLSFYYSERPSVGGVSIIYSRNSAPSRKGCVVDGPMTKASNTRIRPPPVSTMVIRLGPCITRVPPPTRSARGGQTAGIQFYFIFGA